MRMIEALSIEKIDDQLCLVFKADDNRVPGILGAISVNLLKDTAASFARSAEIYCLPQSEIPGKSGTQFPIREFLTPK